MNRNTAIALAVLTMVVGLRGSEDSGLLVEQLLGGTPPKQAPVPPSPEVRRPPAPQSPPATTPAPQPPRVTDRVDLPVSGTPAPQPPSNPLPPPPPVARPPEASQPAPAVYPPQPSAGAVPTPGAVDAPQPPMETPGSAKKAPVAALAMLGVFAMVLLGGSVIGVRAMMRAGKKRDRAEEADAEDEDVAGHVDAEVVPPKLPPQNRPAKPAADDSGGVEPMTERPEMTMRTPPPPPEAGGGGGGNALVPRAALQQMKADFEAMLRSAVDNALAAQRSEYEALLRRQADQIEKMGSMLTEAAQAIEFARSLPPVSVPPPDFGADRAHDSEAGPGQGDDVTQPAAGGNSGY